MWQLLCQSCEHKCPSEPLRRFQFLSIKCMEMAAQVLDKFHKILKDKWINSLL